MPNDLARAHSGLKPLRDLLFGISIAVIILHCYHHGYPVFLQWQLTTGVTDRLIGNFFRSSWTRDPVILKSVALVALALAQTGAGPASGNNSGLVKMAGITCTGLSLYYFSDLPAGLFRDPATRDCWYMALTLAGWVLVF